MHKYKILNGKTYGLKYIVWKNSTPILREAIGGNHNKVSFPGNNIFCRTCVLAVPRTI